jgi:membrane protein
VGIDTESIIDFGKRLKDGVAEDDLSGGAAEMAYRFFLAIFPFFIFLAALGGFVASALDVQNPTDEIMDLIGESLPEDSANVLRTQLEAVLGQQNAGLLSVGILGAIWASAGGIGALMQKLNRIHDVGETRGMPARIAISLALTILAAGLMVIAFVILFVGQVYGPQIAAEIGLADTAADALSLARWPVVLLLVLTAVALLYWLGPNADLPFRWITPGAVFFAVGWAVASVGFGLYVSNFSSYNETYGALGGVVILLIWFYLTSFLLLLGAEINNVLMTEVADAPADAVRDEAGAAPDEGRQPLAGVRGHVAGTAPGERAAMPAAGAGRTEHGQPRALLPVTPGDAAGDRNGANRRGFTGTLGYGLTGVLWAMLLIGVMRRTQP